MHERGSRFCGRWFWQATRERAIGRPPPNGAGPRPVDMPAASDQASGDRWCHCPTATGVATTGRRRVGDHAFAVVTDAEGNRPGSCRQRPRAVALAAHGDQRASRSGRRGHGALAPARPWSSTTALAARALDVAELSTVVLRASHRGSPVPVAVAECWAA